MSDTTPPSPASPRVSDTWGIVVAALLLPWIVAVAVGGHALAWLGVEVAGAVGVDAPRWLPPLLAAGQWLALALPLFPLAWLWRGRRYRAVFGTWALGAAFFGLLVPLRFVPPSSTLLAAGVQGALVALFLAGLALWLRRRGQTPTWRGGALWPALAVAPLVALPWLLWNALGSPLDTLLALGVSLLVGVAAGWTIGGVLLPGLAATSRGAGWDVALGGWAVSGLLAMMAVAVGVGGAALLAGLMVPALGWAVVGLARGGEGRGRWQGIAALVGLALAAPLALVDPDELTLLLNVGGRDVLAWSLGTAGLSALVGLALGVVAWALRHRLPRGERATPWLAGAGASWLVGALVYVGVGQPGFHGDRLFVILKAQADLSAAATIAERDARLRFVYETLTTHADQTQAGLRGSLHRLRVPHQPYYLVNAIEVRGGPLHRLWLETRPEVDRVLASPVLRPLPAPAEAAEGSASAPDGPAWNLTLIGAERVWAEFGARGQGIVIGQSDSGVQGDHPELADSYRGRDAGDAGNWFDPWDGTRRPTDRMGHGTHTLGSVLGNTVGVAPDAEWIGCVNLARNLANPALYLDCLQFMLAPFPPGSDPLRDGDPSRAAHVLNNSWGCPTVEGCDATALLPAVRALRAAGIFVVASAGNEGLSGCSSVRDPIALYDEVFSVGAVGEGGALAGFSSRGPVTADGSGRTKPDIVAPGAGVLSAFPGSSYEVADGTSMAGPHVAGVVALMWSANPALVGDIERTERILRETARPIRNAPGLCDDPGALPSNEVGYGLVDAWAAVRAANGRE